MNTENKTLVTYTRNRKNNLNGCVVAVGNCEHGHHIGWSLCGHGDVFNKNTAKNIAFNRATRGSVVPIPHSIRADWVKMNIRASKYFKTNPL